jgi:general secretion pathway protein A
MDYFSILNLDKEPFSNSPDPEFFFHSRQHLDCLQKLELSLLLRRGLNVIIGDVGTGKTTMCRQIIRRFSQKEEIKTHLILDPHFLNASEFLGTVAEMFTGHKPPVGSHDWKIKEKIKQHLFSQGVDENKTTVLIIDEGQKIPAFCLEILREFLNYETNEFKLLQIVIFAQREFEGAIHRYPNFADRINLYHLLKPLSFRDTRLMIKFRLEKSSNSRKKLNLFTYPALWAAYRITGGYPRKIINLCHQSILAMIIQNRSKVGFALINACARRVFPQESHRKRILRATAVTAGAAAVILMIWLASGRSIPFPSQGIQDIKSVFVSKLNPQAGRPLPEAKPETFRAQIAPTDFEDQHGKESDPIPPVKPSASAQPQYSNGKAAQNNGPPTNELVADTIENPPPTQPSVNVRDSLGVAKEAPLVASADTAPDKSLTVLIPESTYAAILGRITLKRNETLSRIIQRVYGGFNSKYFKSFIMVNPHIEDPDRVAVGQVISLPAIPARVTPSASPVWWVKVDERDSLEAAFNMLRNPPAGYPALRLIPYWNPADGTRFAVVLERIFRDERAARTQLRQLPADLSPNPALLSLWDKRTIFFADPYFDGKY